MTSFLLNFLSSLTVAVVLAVGRWAWEQHKETLEDWYYIARYRLTKPFKPPPKTTATLTAQVVGRIRSRRNPYTGEWETSKIAFNADATDP